MKQDGRFVGVDWATFNEYLPATLLEDFTAETSPTEFPVDLDNPAMETAISLNAHHENIRNELVVRFLAAMSSDYEKQWYLGMIRRSTLDILIKSVEEAKAKCSLDLHWQLLVKHFRLPFFLRHLIRLNPFNPMNQWTHNLLFDHIIQTIELTLGERLNRTQI